MKFKKRAYEFLNSYSETCYIGSQKHFPVYSNLQYISILSDYLCLLPVLYASVIFFQIYPTCCLSRVV